jgi:hypothetical protein
MSRSPIPERAESRFDEEPHSTYTYRRRLGAGDLVQAAAVGLGVGLAAFYVARLFLERTPLVPRTGSAASAGPRLAKPRRTALPLAGGLARLREARD